MDAESSHLCPECGKPVPAGSPHQLCPACLMGQALASRTLVDGDDDSDVPPPLSPEEIAEKFPQFEITECLGRGGMGSVYKARQKSLNRWVAIKILAPEREGRELFAERFAREAQTLARLSHPHIVTIHDFGQTDGLFYLVMEYIDGVNLRELLRDGKIEPAQALTIVPPICDALQYAHDKGVVHRDIKPENLLLDRDGRVKIADFGIASLIGAENESAGTPAYMAPEQADAKREVDHRADIYALGVVLYEMLTGERPGKEVIAPSRKVQIDVRLDEIVLRALEKKPELRFQDATLFKTQVEAIAEADEPRAETGKEYDAPSVPARAPLKRKLFRFVQAFASAFGTIWLILILAEIVARPHFTFGNPVVYGLLVISGVYGAWRSRPSAQPLSRAGQFFEGFSSAFGTVFLVGCVIVLFTASKFSIHGYELAGLSAASLIYAFWQDRRAYASSSGESSKNRRAVVLVKGALVLVTVGLAVGYFIESSRSHVPKDVHTPQTERTLAASPPTPPDTTPASPSFGPVIEREIPPAEDDAHGLTFFSLARGEVVKPPFPVKFTTTVWMGGVPQNGFSFIEITPQLQEWAKARSVDLIFAFEPGSWHWQTLEARIRDGFMSKRSFDSISSAEAIDAFSRPPRFWNDPQKDGALDKAYIPHVASFWSYPEADKDVWPGAFNIYKTRTGQVGIMEIMARPAGEGVKLRYKLVQEPGASPEAHEKEPARPPVAEERYSLKVQFGDGPNDPELTTDVELGVAFSGMKVVGKRTLSIDGRIDPPTDGLYRGQLQYLDVDSSKDLSAQKSSCELALKLGEPFRFVTVSGIARTCVVTLTHQQPDDGTRASQSWDPWAESVKKGDILLMNGDSTAALEHYQNSLGAAGKTKQAWLRNRRLAESHLKIGDILSTRGDLAGASDHYRSSVAAREEQAKESPQDPDVKKQLTWTWVKLGDVQKAQGDLKGALTSYRGGKEGEARYRQGFDAMPIADKPNEPLNPVELTRLAANPKSPRDVRRLMLLINLAGAQKDASFRFLLDKPELRKNAGIEMALLGYDYSVNGNKEALESLLAKLAQQEVGSDSGVVGVLSFIDEWDRSTKAVNAHFTVSDGAGGIVQGLFWLSRAYLFPRQMLEFKGEAGEGAPLKATSPPGRSEPVILSIDPDGTLLLSGEPCPEEKLQERLTALGEKNPDTQVTLRASKLVPYSRVVSILETCQRANLRNISFTTH
jgi:tRNA A-37 threonylcarbamoyl transferase component Bud32/tetratricopeptide (TPR) repeat protein